MRKEQKQAGTTQEGLRAIDIKGNTYVPVDERLRHFRTDEAYAGYALLTEITHHSNGTVCIKAIVLDEHDRPVATGHALERADSSFINKTSHVENCETSAIGRALACLGIGIDTSLASFDEVANAINQQAGNGAATRQRQQAPAPAQRPQYTTPDYPGPGQPFPGRGRHGVGGPGGAQPAGGFGGDAGGQECAGQVIVPQGAPQPSDDQWNVLWDIKGHFDKLGAAHKQICDMTQLLAVVWGTYHAWPTTLEHGDAVKKNGKIKPVRFMQPVAA